MFKLSQEEIDKMKEEVKELKKKIERLEWFIKINEYDPNEHKVYEGGSDLQLNYEDTDNGKYNKTIKKQSLFDVYEPPFECCKNCSNNPKNNKFASGFCCCDLPYKEMIIW